MTRNHSESIYADAGIDRTALACLASGPLRAGRRRSDPRLSSPASCRGCFGWRLPPRVGFASSYAAPRRGRRAPPCFGPPVAASLPSGGSGGGIRAAVSPRSLASLRPAHFGGVHASPASIACPAAERSFRTFGGVGTPSGIVAVIAAEPPGPQKSKEKRAISNNGPIFYSMK